MSLTHARFAVRCMQIVVEAAGWSRDAMSEAEVASHNPMRREPVEQFIREMRERLDNLEEELNR
jgi:hypothetical protein